MQLRIHLPAKPRVLLSVTALVFALSAAPAWAVDWSTLPYTLHADFQAVTETAGPGYTGGFPLRMQGVLISSPGDIFDNSPNFIPVNWPSSAFAFGGIQQVYFQAVEPGDLGGTAMYMAQCLGNHPINQDDEFSYTDAEWLAELDRINHDPATGHAFQAGDLVEVRARIGLHYAGKFNINEAHDNTPANDFDVILLQAGYGLPTPQPITVADIKDDNDAYIFDDTRITGGERYQAQRVTLRGVSIVDPENWGAFEQITVTDGTLTLPVLLGSDPGFDDVPAPEGVVHITGIFDQEASPAPNAGDNGYRLIATSLADFAVAATCPGDLNGDWRTDLADHALFTAALDSGDLTADLDNSGVVDLHDYALFQIDFGCGEQ